MATGSFQLAEERLLLGLRRVFDFPEVDRRRRAEDEDDERFLAAMDGGEGEAERRRSRGSRRVAPGSSLLFLWFILLRRNFL